MSEKFILGNGLSGKIWKFYNPEFSLIGPEQKRDPFGRSQMIWLHDCPEMRQLLFDLGIEGVGTRIAKIGYYETGVIKDHADGELKASLVARKMTDWKRTPEVYAPKKKQDASTRLSLGDGEDKTNYMTVLDISPQRILDALAIKTTFDPGMVSKISPTHVTFSLGEEEIHQKYSKLVSTLPATIFWKLWGAEVMLKSQPITFVITREKPEDFAGTYEMCYYDVTKAFTRISALDGVYCVEFTGVITKREVEKLMPEIKVEDIWTIPGGRIESYLTLPPQNIIFSGRFAQWDHNIVTEHVVSEAQKYRRLNAA